MQKEQLALVYFKSNFGRTVYLTFVVEFTSNTSTIRR